MPSYQPYSILGHLFFVTKFEKSAAGTKKNGKSFPLHNPQPEGITRNLEQHLELKRHEKKEKKGPGVW